MSRDASHALRQTLADSHWLSRRSLRNEKVRGSSPLSSTGINVGLTRSFVLLAGEQDCPVLLACAPGVAVVRSSWLDRKIVYDQADRAAWSFLDELRELRDEVRSQPSTLQGE
jgi:hypothetical protein